MDASVAPEGLGFDQLAETIRRFGQQLLALPAAELRQLDLDPEMGDQFGRGGSIVEVAKLVLQCLDMTE